MLSMAWGYNKKILRKRDTPRINNFHKKAARKEKGGTCKLKGT